MQPKKPRRIARELALLALSIIKGKEEKIEHNDLQDLVLASIRTLTSEIQDTLFTAGAEVQRGSDLCEQIRCETPDRLSNISQGATNVQSAKAMVADALELTRTAIERLGTAVELPEFIQLSNHYEVREYALDLISTVRRKNKEITELLSKSLVDWQLERLPRIDRDILRIAVAEILFLDLEEQVAINEAVELAKRYSDEDGYKFINGVLRRVTDRMKAVKQLVVTSYQLPGV